jgi:hypothetical protein
MVAERAAVADQRWEQVGDQLLLLVRDLVSAWFGLGKTIRNVRIRELASVVTIRRG